jgi:hypothetical protein
LANKEKARKWNFVLVRQAKKLFFDGVPSKKNWKRKGKGNVKMHPKCVVPRAPYARRRAASKGRLPS